METSPPFAFTDDSAVLLVEGQNDVRVISQFLEQRGVPWVGPITDLMKGKRGDQGAVKLFDDAVGKGSARRVGLIVDADVDSQSRWISVRDKLRLEFKGSPVPDQIPASGFLVETAAPKRRIGVWVMPDNRLPGKLEDFVKLLVPAGDEIWGVAERATSCALATGKGLKEKDRSKGEIGAWLAWQDEPGSSMGLAIEQRLLSTIHGPTQDAFYDWFVRLYGV